MPHVIPAINAPDFETVEAQVALAHQFLPPGGWVHIDVTDGEFSPHLTWNNPAELTRLKANADFSHLNFEIHLMVHDPELVAGHWIKAGASRLIVHAEAIHETDIFLDECERANVEAMIAENPETPAQKFSPYFGKFKYFQILAVKPGRAGQKFQPEVLEKIKFLRTNAPDAIIEVDGGITPETARVCKEAGAHIFVAASYIFKAKEPKIAYQDLLKSTHH